LYYSTFGEHLRSRSWSPISRLGDAPFHNPLRKRGPSDAHVSELSANLFAMIAVISDLHFEEEASDVIRGNGKEIVFRRNLDPKAYRSFIAQMANEARRRKAKSFELVIAGDLFDFSRTSCGSRMTCGPMSGSMKSLPNWNAKF
jgi:Tfp pilus assembly pilus retraction ATPase PilT